MKLFVALTASAMLFAGAAVADDAPEGGPTIKGGVELNVQAADDISAAVGNESTAAQELGDVNAGNIEGDVEVGVSADGDISAAVGNKSCSSQKVGSIGGKGNDC